MYLSEIVNILTSFPDSFVPTIRFSILNDTNKYASYGFDKSGLLYKFYMTGSVSGDAVHMRLELLKRSDWFINIPRHWQWTPHPQEIGVLRCTPLEKSLKYSDLKDLSTEKLFQTAQEMLGDIPLNREQFFLVYSIIKCSIDSGVYKCP